MPVLSYFVVVGTVLVAALFAAGEWFPAAPVVEGKTVVRPKIRIHTQRVVPAALDLHLIIDNYATHKHPKVRAWLASRPRYHVHYTPTYSSWLNQVERWFGLITQRSIRRGSFRNVKELVQRIETYVKHHNRHAGPFQWTATADSILGKIERLSKVISGTQH